MSYAAFYVIIMQQDIIEIFMNFAALLVVIEIDNVIGTCFLNMLTAYENLLVVKDSNISLFEIRTKVISTMVFVIMYSSMMYSYFIDKSHCSLMRNLE